jgi:hypothetical protein
LRDGTDPGQQRKLGKLASAVAAQNTLASIAEDYTAPLKEEWHE